MADRDAVAGFQAAEIPALHGAGETLALGGATDIDLLAGHEMRGRQRGARLQQRIRRDTELHQLGLGLHLRLGEMAAVGLETFFTFALPRPS